MGNLELSSSDMRRRPATKGLMTPEVGVPVQRESSSIWALKGSQSVGRRDLMLAPPRPPKLPLNRPLRRRGVAVLRVVMLPDWT